jgi:hypothetical protein
MCTTTRLCLSQTTASQRGFDEVQTPYSFPNSERVLVEGHLPVLVLCSPDATTNMGSFARTENK